MTDTSQGQKPVDTLFTPSSATLFGLIRHGQTEWNVEKKIQGSCDSPLTALGRQQARDWRATLLPYDFTRILCSPQQRALDTARILREALHIPLETEDRLREQHWGAWEGMTLQTLRTAHHEELERRIAMGWQFAAPDGETRETVCNRVEAALHDAAHAWPGEKILLVSHQGVINSTLYRLAGRQYLPSEEPLIRKNSLHLLQHRGGALAVLQLNIDRVKPA